MRSAFFGLAVAIAAMTAEAEIAVRAAQCNDVPYRDEIAVVSADRTPDEFVTAFNGDPAYRARFDNVDRARADPIASRVWLRLPPLADPVVEAGTLERTGAFHSVDVARFACIWSPPFMPSVTVVEYHDTLHDRYFMTADRAEQAAIDAGSAGPQWTRTGYTFVADLYADGCGTLAPVYRFTGVPDIGPASHFFTSSTAECAFMRDRADGQWMFEGVAFGALPFVSDGCPNGVPPALMSRTTVALYRAYNNGAGGTPNHRFSIERAVIDAMVAQGWTDEGAVMCVYPP